MDSTKSARTTGSHERPRGREVVQTGPNSGTEQVSWQPSRNKGDPGTKPGADRLLTTEVVPMNQQELTQVVDGALERFRGRDLIASAEVVDVLLDLRLLLLGVESPEQRLDEPAATPAG